MIFRMMLRLVGLYAIATVIVTATSISLNGYIQTDYGTLTRAESFNDVTKQFVLNDASSAGFIGGSGRYSYGDFAALAQFGHLGLAFAADARCPEGFPTCGSESSDGQMMLFSEDGLRVPGVSSGYILLQVRVNGSVSLVSDPRYSNTAETYYILRSGGGTVFSADASCRNNSSGNCGSGTSGTKDVYIKFVGSAASLLQELAFGFSCEAGGGPDCREKGLFLDSADVGGAVVLDQFFQIVPGATIVSDSGYDYSTPLPAEIPEPGTAGLLVLSVSFLILVLLKQLNRSSWFLAVRCGAKLFSRYAITYR